MKQSKFAGGFTLLEKKLHPSSGVKDTLHASRGWPLKHHASFLRKESLGLTGFTLTEASVAMVVLAVAALGALVYQYHAARHSRIAHAQIIGTRTAQLLLEDWKSTGGSSGYDPASLGLGFSSKLEVPSYWSEGDGEGVGTPLNVALYSITVDDVPMLVMLQWKDVDYDNIAEVTLRELKVTIKFARVSELEGTPNPDTVSANIPPVILTTYIRLDASGG